MTQSKSTKTTGVRAGTAAERRRTVKPRVGNTAEPSRATAEPPPMRGPTKQALILGLLQRPEGATLKDLMAATGWLAHTTRAALTRLRQAGQLLDKTTGEAGTVYRIAMPARTARSRKAA